MGIRAVLGVGTAALLLAIAGGAAWWELVAAPTYADAADAETRLPIPPVPPRIAQGDQYESCLAMLPADPEGAQALAETWQTAGGGTAAEHCLALARIELGDPEDGATLLEKIGTDSKSPAAARATILGQATQAWLMTGDANRALASATLALSLSSDDADLLIDRSVAAGALARWQDAVDDLTHALDEDPRRPDAMVLRGSAWRHLGQLDLADDDIARALAMDPENAEGLLERGIIRERRNDRLGARTDWEHAIALAPDSPAADLAQQNLALLEAGPDHY
jgi:tetratricopeptide (TPR) repeat protein